MPTQIKQQNTPVQAAQAEPTGLWLTINSMPTRVDAKPRIWAAGIVVLTDNDLSMGYFSENYLVHLEADPADNADALDIRGGTMDPVVLAVVEEWLAGIPYIGMTTSLPITRSTRSCRQLGGPTGGSQRTRLGNDIAGG